MNTGIVQNHKGFFFDRKRQNIQLLENKLTVNAFKTGSPMTLVLASDQAKTIDSMTLFNPDTDLFIVKLPTIRHVAFRTHARLITVEKVNMALPTEFFQLCQLRKLVLDQCRTRLLAREFSYAFVASAKPFKKRRKVWRDIFLPLAASNSALAVCIR